MVGADPAKVLAAYREAKPDATPGELMIAALGDWFFRIPAIRVAEARKANGAETFVYEFCWRSPQFDGHLGACHALEVGFVFDNLDDPAGRADARFGSAAESRRRDARRVGRLREDRLAGMGSVRGRSHHAHVRRGEHHRRRSGGCSASRVGGRALTAARVIGSAMSAATAAGSSAMGTCPHPGRLKHAGAAGSRST